MYIAHLEGNSPVAVTTASTLFILASSPPPFAALASYTVAPSRVSSWCQSPTEAASLPVQYCLG